MTTDDLRDYVAEHRDDLYCALREDDRWARTMVIAALIAAGDAEVQLAKIELEQTVEEQELAP